jgi:hypothetical protein
MTTESSSAAYDLGIPPEPNGCYGWPRACEHDDDLACLLAESMADPEFATAYFAAEVRFNRRWPGCNRPVAVKPSARGRRHAW